MSHYLSLQVFVVDNYFTGRKRNIENWLGHENFELIHHDIVNPILLEVGSTYCISHLCVQRWMRYIILHLQPLHHTTCTTL